MYKSLIRPRKAVAGDKVAVLSPSFAAPAVAPEVHEQAMRRLEELTGLVPVEYPTTRRLGASTRDRAADLNAAFADPEIRAVLATIGGEDQITVVPHLDPDLVRADPKPFLGYSDNTNGAAAVKREPLAHAREERLGDGGTDSKTWVWHPDQPGDGCDLEDAAYEASPTRLAGRFPCVAVDIRRGRLPITRHPSAERNPAQSPGKGAVDGGARDAGPPAPATPAPES